MAKTKPRSAPTVGLWAVPYRLRVRWRQALKLPGKTQAGMARAAGVNPETNKTYTEGYISQIMNAPPEVTPSMPGVPAICYYLGIPYAYFADAEQERLLTALDRVRTRAPRAAHRWVVTAEEHAESIQERPEDPPPSDIRAVRMQLEEEPVHP